MPPCCWTYEAGPDAEWAGLLLWWDRDAPSLPYSCWLVMAPLVDPERGHGPLYGRGRLAGVVTVG